MALLAVGSQQSGPVRGDLGATAPLCSPRPRSPPHHGTFHSATKEGSDSDRLGLGMLETDVCEHPLSRYDHRKH